MEGVLWVTRHVLAADDPRWGHHADHPSEHGDRFVDQEFRLVDEHGRTYVHIERGVNVRARTDRPPVDDAPTVVADEVMP